MAKYLPKLYHFQLEHMELGTMLAALDNKFNACRSQKHSVELVEKGLGVKIKRHFRVAYRKPNKKFIARKSYEEKSYYYLLELMDDIRRRAASGEKDLSETKRVCMAPKKRLSKEEMVQNCMKFSRFC